MQALVLGLRLPEIRHLEVSARPLGVPRPALGMVAADRLSLARERGAGLRHVVLRRRSFRLGLAGRPFGEPVAPTLVAPRGRPSIAVLRFANLSDDPDRDWLVDGLTEDASTDLAQISGLLVIARHSTFAYKGRGLGPEEIARDLKVRTSVRGSKRRAGDLVRVNVQLGDGPSSSGRSASTTRWAGCRSCRTGSRAGSSPR